MTKNQVIQTIDFEEMFGVDLSANRGLKLAMGQALLDRILERTARGLDVEGNRFAPYSDAYKNSLDFKAFGKSDNVNMELSGDMLGLMDIVEENENDVVIGWTDELEILKAQNHILGDTVPKRDFFGASQADIDAVASMFGSELDRIRELQSREDLDQDIASITSALEIFEAFERATGNQVFPDPFEVS